jgi:hypothetical protein
VIFSAEDESLVQDDVADAGAEASGGSDDEVLKPPTMVSELRIDNSIQ